MRAMNINHIGVIGYLFRAIEQPCITCAVNVIGTAAGRMTSARTGRLMHSPDYIYRR
jgi:hypothetical protein